jgi:hypothetical protein
MAKTGAAGLNTRPPYNNGILLSTENPVRASVPQFPPHASTPQIEPIPPIRPLETSPDDWFRSRFLDRLAQTMRRSGVGPWGACLAASAQPADVHLRKAMRQQRSERAKKTRNQKGEFGKKARKRLPNTCLRSFPPACTIGAACFPLMFIVPFYVGWRITTDYCRKTVCCPRCGASLWDCGTGNFKTRRMQVPQQSTLASSPCWTVAAGNRDVGDHPSGFP